MRIPGLTSVTQSCRRVADPRKALSVYVCRSEISGATIQFAAPAGRVESARQAPNVHQTLARVMAISAVIRPGHGLRRLVEDRIDDRTGLHRRERGLERGMAGA